jgi:hypothetical protein
MRDQRPCLRVPGSSRKSATFRRTGRGCGGDVSGFNVEKAWGDIYRNRNGDLLLSPVREGKEGISKE